MEDLSLHILDIAENAIRAKAKRIVIEVLEDEKNDRLTVSIEDDGEGMDQKIVKEVVDPFFTTKKGKKVGLGLSLLSQATQQTGGNFKIDSQKGRGTNIKAVFTMSHPDRKPLGDILKTLMTLVAGDPSIQFIYNYDKSGYHYHFDSYE